MKVDLPCKQLGCTTCCKWGNQAITIGIEGMDCTDEGNCIHLNEEGCSLYGKPERPKLCDSFSCIIFLDILMGKSELLPLINIIAAAVSAKIKLIADANKTRIITKQH